jgi:quercetin dioxygenase-like cupin family protein
MSHYFPTTDEFGRHTIFPGVTVQTCAGDQLMLSLVELKPNSVVEEHAHPHEQAGLILEGEALFTIGGEQKLLRAGDMYRAPSNVRHKVEVGGLHTRVIDVFCPVREEYR